jgi:hypothetical protein
MEQRPVYRAGFALDITLGRILQELFISKIHDHAQTVANIDRL